MNNDKNDPPLIPENFITIAQLKERWTLQQQHKKHQRNKVSQNDSVLSGSDFNTPNLPVREPNLREEKIGDELPKARCHQRKNDNTSKARGEGSGNYAPSRRDERGEEGIERGREGEVIVESKVLTLEVGKMSLGEGGRGGGNVKVVNRGREGFGGRGRFRFWEESRRVGRRQGGGGMVWVKKGGGGGGGSEQNGAGKFRSSGGLRSGN